MSALAEIASWGLIIAGSVFVLVGTLGLVRLPDVYTRLHGAGMTDTMGAGLLIAGMLIQSPHWLITAKLVLILVFMAFTSPMTSHALARAALLDGVKPWTRNAAREERP